MPEEYADYGDVPWYRQYVNVNILILVGFFAIAPLLWAACVICLTGDIYLNERDHGGALAKCPSTTKTAALIVLIVHTAIAAYVIQAYF